jgi:hypothetical protein
MKRMINPVIFVLRGLLGYTVGFVPLFAILAFAFKIPLKELVGPYFLLMVPFILFVGIQQSASRFVPSPALRLSLATASSLLLCLPVFSHYATKLGLFGPGFANLFLWSGIVGAAVISVSVFYLKRRRVGDP